MEPERGEQFLQAPGGPWAQPSSLPCSTLPPARPAQAPGRDTPILPFKRITNYCLIH